MPAPSARTIARLKAKRKAKKDKYYDKLAQNAFSAYNQAIASTNSAGPVQATAASTASISSPASSALTFTLPIRPGRSTSTEAQGTSSDMSFTLPIRSGRSTLSQPQTGSTSMPTNEKLKQMKLPTVPHKSGGFKSKTRRGIRRSRIVDVDCVVTRSRTFDEMVDDEKYMEALEGRINKLPAGEIYDDSGDIDKIKEVYGGERVEWFYEGEGEKGDEDKEMMDN